MKLDLKNKSGGFFCSLAVVVLSLVFAIFYAASFANTRNMSWAAFVLIIVSVALGLALLVIKKLDWFAPIAFCVHLVAFVLYAIALYSYVLDAMVGIDVVQVSATFVVSVVLFILMLIADVFSVCLAQNKVVNQ